MRALILLTSVLTASLLSAAPKPEIREPDAILTYRKTEQAELNIEAYRPTRRGFDHQYGHWFGAIDYFTHMRDGTLDWHRDDQPSKDEGYSTHLIAKEACRVIREKNPDKPPSAWATGNCLSVPAAQTNSTISPKTSVRRTITTPPIPKSSRNCAQYMMR